MRYISGDYLRKLREDHGWSLREFSKKIYASKSSVQRWEKSNLPDDEELLKKIAEAFNMTVEQFYEKSQESNTVHPTEKQLTEMQFGINGLAIILGFLCVFVLLFILIYK